MRGWGGGEEVEGVGRWRKGWGCGGRGEEVEEGVGRWRKGGEVGRNEMIRLCIQYEVQWSNMRVGYCCQLYM